MPYVQIHKLPSSSALANKSLWWLQAPRETSRCIVGPGPAVTPHKPITRTAPGSGRLKLASSQERTPTGLVQANRSLINWPDQAGVHDTGREGTAPKEHEELRGTG